MKRLEENSKVVNGILTCYMQLDDSIQKLGISNDVSVELEVTALTPYGEKLVKLLKIAIQNLEKEEIMAKKEVQTAKVLNNPVKKTKTMPKCVKPKSGK